MRYELKTIGVWSFIKISFLFNIAVGFIGGLCVAFSWAVYTTAITTIPQLDMGGDVPDESSLGAMLIILPVLGAIGGGFFYTLFATVVVMIYNFLARMLGGIELELNDISLKQDKEETRPVAATAGGPPLPPPPQRPAVPRTGSTPPPPASATRSPESTDNSNE